MDYLKNKRAAASIQDTFGAKYNPLEDLDPAVAQEIQKYPEHVQPRMINEAYDKAGTFMKLKRMLKGLNDGEVK
jgi:hypothetical protein